MRKFIAGAALALVVVGASGTAFAGEVTGGPHSKKTPGGDNAMLTLMSNLMLVVPAGPIQPYALIGLGLIRPHAEFDATNLTTSQAL